MFTYRGENLFCEDVSVSDLAKQIGTPFYCYSAGHIISQYENFRGAFRDVDSQVCYSVKANSNQAILVMLAKLGSGADIVSLGELRRARAANIESKKIVFSGVGKQKKEIDEAIAENILCFNIESKSELELLAARAKELGKSVNISVRINPNVDGGTHKKITTGTTGDKFGININDAAALYNFAAELENINVSGIDVHIGSQISQSKPFEKTFKCLAKLHGQLTSQGHKIEHIDVGGGLGVDYGDGKVLELEEYAECIKKELKKLNVKILFEPGRFLVANAGILVTKILYIKGGKKNFIIVDAAMNDLLRPTLYDARHKIIPLRKEEGKSIVADIVGPVCESGDFLAQGYKLKNPKEGDELAITATGAYGAVQSSTYNSRPLVAEVLVKGGNHEIIRKKQSYENLISQDKVPSWI